VLPVWQHVVATGRTNENLFGGLSAAYEFVDLAPRSYGTRPVAHRRHDFAALSPHYRARLSAPWRLRPLCLGTASIHQTGSDHIMCELYIRYSAPTLHHGRALSPGRATSYSIITLPRIPCPRGATGAGPSPRSSERFRSPRRHRRADAATRLASPIGPNRIVSTRSAAPATDRCGQPAHRIPSLPTGL
jgi:hypothetical protein